MRAFGSIAACFWTINAAFNVLEEIVGVAPHVEPHWYMASLYLFLAIYIRSGERT